MHSSLIQATSRGPATPETLKPCAKTEADRGSAIVEFIGLSVLLAIPLMYLMLAISMVQASNLAAVAAADQAARIVSHSNATPDSGTAGTRERAEHAIADVMDGYGIAADNASLSVECSGPCPGPGSLITARVEVRVPLPFVPEGVQGIVKTHSETTMVVGEPE
ncbi:pilus assembly protein [Pseudoglutamicibacter cumminsii]|uniref:pilus assembly protein n=1 Tax=Pseudoglutamicibacter cumminsii TaxID=156979 RepID=UPI0026F0456C|nr:pilus assembly protein [Pseudoglutamicibacter cumminsii]